jgi:transcriptional regulator with XRE-family HTH domain
MYAGKNGSVLKKQMCTRAIPPIFSQRGMHFRGGKCYSCGERTKEVSQMDQSSIGKFIAQKRKGLNMTQEQLAERLGVSNKTVSKWENGKCMPDYSIVERLCEELKITISELMDGEEAEDKSVRVYDDAQILDLLRRTQELEKQKKILKGTLLIVMGIAFQALSHTIGGTDVKDFVSGLLLGLSIAEMLAGIWVIAKGSIKK